MTRLRRADRRRTLPGFEELPRNAGDDDPVVFDHEVQYTQVFEELPRNAGDDDVPYLQRYCGCPDGLRRTAPQRRG